MFLDSPLLQSTTSVPESLSTGEYKEIDVSVDNYSVTGEQPKVWTVPIHQVRASVLLHGFPGLQVLADLPKGVERNGVSVNLPVFVERELRLSRYLGLNQAET